jgi:GNAT superfamily N-acetyltransferase
MSTPTATLNRRDRPALSGPLRRRWPTALGLGATGVTLPLVLSLPATLSLTIRAWSVLLAGVIYLTWGTARGELTRPRQLAAQTAAVLALGAAAVTAAALDHEQGLYLLAAAWFGLPNVLTGVIDPSGCTTLAVPESDANRVSSYVGQALRQTGLSVRDHGGDIDAALVDVPAAVGRPEDRIERVHLRWTVAPADLPAIGVWVALEDPMLPTWLRPFGGPALCAIDDRGRVVAGVGVKRHDSWVHELAVVTQPEARGRGLARRLVSQAARELLQCGIVPTYLHQPSNTASARVAEAAGFRWSGWKALLLNSAV